jgi:hypothetical protein
LAGGVKVEGRTGRIDTIRACRDAERDALAKHDYVRLSELGPHNFLGERWLAVAGMANFALGNLMRAAGWLPLAVAGSVVLGFALPWLFLALLNLTQRCTPPELQGRVSAVVALAFFGPQAPLQALGALVIRYATYGELYLAGAAVAVATGAVFARADRRRNVAVTSDEASLPQLR